MTQDCLEELDAVGIAAAIAANRFSAADAVEASLQRIARLNPQLNFVASSMAETARAAARAPTPGPFSGVPTLIKDLLAWRGAKLMSGSRAMKDFVADTQGPYANALAASGLIAVGKSTTPEFGFTATTEPVLTGATRNPWDINRSSGGSSGGAAAAVASGAVPIAHASDGGGSIRIPASACGLVGLKVSRGRLIDDRADDIVISVDGCVSRSVRDTIAWLRATERKGSDRVFDPLPSDIVPTKTRLRIGVQIDSIMGIAPHEEVAAGVEAVGALLAKMGHDVRAFQYPIAGPAISEAFTLNWAAFAARELTQALKLTPPGTRPEDVFEPLSLGLKMMHDVAPPGAIAAAVKHMYAVADQYRAALADIDVVISPVLGAPTVPIGKLDPTQPIDIFAENVPRYVAYTPLHNTAGAPAMSLPLAQDSRGCPIGVMFAAKPGDEATLLSLALAVEQAAPWAALKPAVHA